MQSAWGRGGGGGGGGIRAIFNLWQAPLSKVLGEQKLDESLLTQASSSTSFPLFYLMSLANTGRTHTSGHSHAVKFMICQRLAHTDDVVVAVIVNLVRTHINKKSSICVRQMAAQETADKSSVTTLETRLSLTLTDGFSRVFGGPPRNRTDVDTRPVLASCSARRGSCDFLALSHF